jgi:formate dehydrogenase alpha subunit
MTIHLTINDQPIEAREGQTVLEVARAHGIVIPTLCHHKDLSPVGSCRLCVVAIEKLRGEIAACALPVSEGMVVQTETPALIASRKRVLEMLLRTYVDARPERFPKPFGSDEDSEFMRWVKHYDVRLPDGVTPVARYQVDSDPNPFVWVDFNKCILCTRCVRACAEVQGRFVWGVGQRGAHARIIAGADTTMLAARCESCGACAAYCPTGALTDRMAMDVGQPDKLVLTTCAYCGVGCQLDLNVKDGKVVRVTSNPSAPVNGMSLCVKGRYGYDFIHHSDRLTKPRVRQYLLDQQKTKNEQNERRALHGHCERSEAIPLMGQEIASHTTLAMTHPRNVSEWVEVDWDTALDIVARKLVAIKRESGSDALGVMASAKCANEENYVMQKFARQVIGTNNVDHCARLCHASTVAGLAMCFGSGAMSNTMDDVAQNAKAIFIIGSNTTEQHPVFGAQLRQAVLRRGVPLVVADPRAIDITEFATLHIRQKPGTDVALLNGLMRIILRHGWHAEKFIAERCENFEVFAATIEKYTPQLVSNLTGVSVTALQRAAELLALNHPMAVIWAMGITQHTTGVMNVLSLGNLQMLLGNMGVSGGGVNPLRGQNNVQGACDMGALPNVFSGYQAVTDATVREKFERAWALRSGDGGRQSAADASPVFRLSSSVGLTVTEMIPRAGEGKLRALYILGEDPALTEPDVNHARECLAQCEFVVLQEIFPSVTSALADVLLPGVSFAEKDGTFTNTERRVQLVRQAIAPLGDARPDWAITVELARRIMQLEGREPLGAQAGWHYDSPADIMDEIAVVTPSYGGVSYARLQRGEQLHWPVKSAEHGGTPILHVGQFTRGKGKFHAIDYLPPHELPDAEYPLMLTTGRVLYHWHGGELTRRAQGLMAVYPETLVEISPEDAARLGVNGDGRVRVTSRRGELIAQAIVTERVSAGLVFANFHFPDEQNANNLTIAALDPVAKIPEYKVCAVRVEKVNSSQ